jgi:glycosyltransferase involved in cell wall biosynthesis
MARPANAQTRVLIVGPDPDAQGGIASVLRGVRGATLPIDMQLSYVATYREGSPIRQFVIAVVGLGAIMRLCIMHRIDILHLHTSSGPSFWRKAAALAIGKITGITVILHVHGSDFDTFMEGGSTLRRRVIKAVLERADVVIALSPEWQQKINSITDAHVWVVPNGVDVAASGIRESRHGPIVSIGRLGGRKGTFDLIEAMRGLRTSDAKLVLAGDGDQAEPRRVAELVGVACQVTIAGWLSPEERDKLLDRASVFVLPSYAEGLPMALLEAMAHGVPVIATPVGGIPQAIRDGENGFLVSPGDTKALSERLDLLLGDANLRERLGAAGRQTVQKSFSTDAVVASLVEIYRSLGSTPHSYYMANRE